jgi:type IV secretion system protein VirB9
MSRHLLLLAAMCLVAGTVVPSAEAQVVQSYDYQPDRIYPVYTGLGITTLIELSPNEKILDYSTGFSTGWELTRRDNVFYLKPRNIDVDTNMMVRTETHSYIFELKVVATDWKTLDSARAAGVQYKISFTYPAQASFTKEVAKAEEPPELDTSLVKGRSYNFDYDYAMPANGAPWLVPASVYDDGRFTYIKVSDTRQFPTGNFPAVYMRQREHGDDAVVNTTIEGNTIVIHGTYPFLVIRHDSGVVGLRRNSSR